MSRWKRQGVSHRAAETDEIDYTSHLLVQGSASAWDHPWSLRQDDTDVLDSELQARLALKRPPGFAPWPSA